jgi:cell division septation protein DedD
MADDTRLRATRSEPFQASGAAFERGGAAPSGGDPLSELARLIGQDDLFKQMRRDAVRAGDQYPPPSQPPGEWVERAPRDMAPPRRDLYAAPPQRHEDYAPQRDYSHLNRGPYADEGQDYAPPQGYQPQSYPPTGHRPAAAPAYAGLDSQGYDPRYGTSLEPDYRDWDRSAYGSDQPNYTGQPEYAESEPEQDQFEQAPREKRRGGMLIVAGVVGVAVIGTAGAFAYRAMSGGGEGGQPPVIRADQGPAKVVPPQTATGSAPRTTYDRAGGGKDVNLVPREEQPVEIKDAKGSGPRLIAPTGAGPGLAGNPAQPAAGSPTGSTPLTAPNPNEPKKVRTIAIRPDGSVAPEPTGNRTQPNAGGPSRPGAAPTQPNRNPPARPGASGPQGQLEEPARPPASVPVRTASIPSASNPLPVSAAAPAAAPTPTPSAATSGNFVVQLASQKSEADAQASFRALQSKYPSVLAGRQPLIKRADLGDRGTYFRTQIGPFATADQANDLCGNLKAAGGQCIVQRN